MLLKTARRSLIVSIALAGATTLSASAFPTGISPSSFADGVQYVAQRSAGDGPGCGYLGIFPCSASEWGTCDEGYGSTVFPCSNPGKGRRSRF